MLSPRWKQRRGVRESWQVSSVTVKGEADSRVITTAAHEVAGRLRKGSSRSVLIMLTSVCSQYEQQQLPVHCVYCCMYGLSLRSMNV